MEKDLNASDMKTLHEEKICLYEMYFSSLN